MADRRHRRTAFLRSLRLSLGRSLRLSLGRGWLRGTRWHTLDHADDRRRSDLIDNRLLAPRMLGDFAKRAVRASRDDLLSVVQRDAGKRLQVGEACGIQIDDGKRLHNAWDH